MQPLTTSLLGQACRIFLTLAYPEGPASIPAKKRVYYDLPADQPAANFLPPAASAVGVCQELRTDTAPGYELRLGSSGFPHLKLRFQHMNANGKGTWVFLVDTHDAFSKESRFPPPGHPDAEQWLAMQHNNRVLKEKIELALEEQGLTTLNSILRGDLKG